MNSKKQATTDETAWTPKATNVKPLRPLTRKQQAFVQELISKPKQSAVQAALKTYGKPNKPTTYTTANAIARDNLQKPAILNELAKHSATAEYTLIEVMNQSKDKMYEDKPRSVDWANNARQTANDILNRVHGTPTSKHEVSSTTVTLSLSLTDITGAATTQGDPQIEEN